MIECKTRNIDTPEVGDALGRARPYCRQECKSAGYRNHLKPYEEFGPGRRRPEQNLRVNFGGIYSNVRQILQTRIERLQIRYAKSKSAKVKAEFDRLGRA